ncbi:MULTISPECIES: tryptophan synthase subunit beta like protein [Halomonadaceae]|uniref:tryptophan synthase subunit beta like protein n=1 Tax=Halomonadaceae TaxID=28256 RepID=UPI00159AA507|nr:MULTISPECIES: tryptophan synthase subunit beta like protein [Halomonas]QJQ94138.1 tryptophan synthase subunit beta like protein [Halomonas sp. PA5]
MYIKRNHQGQIEMASRTATSDCCELIAPGSPELADFIGRSDAAKSDELEASDLEFVRVLDDVIELLLAKGTIGYAELPHAARSKLTARQYLRSRSKSVALLENDR